jgi:fatty acid desaturase
LRKAGTGFGLLRYRADRRTLAFLLSFNILLAVQWFGVSRSSYLLLPTYVLAVVALVVKHNQIHSPTFRSQGWNSAFDLYLSILTAMPTSGVITSHNVLHHQHNNTGVDFVRCSLVRSRSNFVNLLFFFFVSVQGMYRNKPSDLKNWRRTQPRLYKQAIAERVATYGFLLLLVVVDWRSTLKYCAGPWLFAQWVLVTINLLQHQDCDFDSEFNHSRNLTGRFLNWLLLNNGYHTAHHMFPGAHWSKLKEIHRREVAPHIEPSLEEKSLWLCLWGRFVLGEGWQGAQA